MAYVLRGSKRLQQPARHYVHFECQVVRGKDGIGGGGEAPEARWASSSRRAEPTWSQSRACFPRALSLMTLVWGDHEQSGTGASPACTLMALWFHDQQSKATQEPHSMDAPSACTLMALLSGGHEQPRSHLVRVHRRGPRPRRLVGPRLRAVPHRLRVGHRRRAHDHDGRGWRRGALEAEQDGSDGRVGEARGEVGLDGARRELGGCEVCDEEGEGGVHAGLGGDARIVGGETTAGLRRASGEGGMKGGWGVRVTEKRKEVGRGRGWWCRGCV